MRRFGRCLLVAAPCLAACDRGADEDRHAAAERAILTASRPIPPGTAPLGATEILDALAQPGPPPTVPVLKRGREGYDVFCTPCHGRAGYGDGAAVRNGFPQPPSFHDDRLHGLTPARIVAVITAGTGTMYPMAERILPGDRWAIAYYVKALQLSQRPGDAPGRPPERGGAGQQ